MDSGRPRAPRMPIDCGLLRIDTAALSTEEFGAYMHLVMAWWNWGRPLNYDNRGFAMVTQLLSVQKWKRVRESIKDLFEVTEAGWVPKPLPWMRGWRGDRRLLPRDAREMPSNWPSIRRAVFERDNFTCRYCKKAGGKLECDHVIPRSRGGADEASNLVTACKPCNRLKLNRTPEEMGWSLH